MTKDHLFTDLYQLATGDKFPEFTMVYNRNPSVKDKSKIHPEF